MQEIRNVQLVGNFIGTVNASAATPLENWIMKPPACPVTTWMKTIQQDLKSNNLSLNVAVDVAQNRPLSNLTDVCVWCYALLVVHVRNEEEEEG